MEKRKKMDPAEEGEGKSKQDFRKALGGGLGMAGLSSALGAQAIADMNKKGKYVFAITRGGNDPNWAIFSLLMAKTVAEKEWGKV